MTNCWARRGTAQPTCVESAPHLTLSARAVGYAFRPNRCLQGRLPAAPGEAGLAVQKILDGICRSANADEEVSTDQ